MTSNNVYLAGAIRNDPDAVDWRNEIKRRYRDNPSFNFLDPLDKYDIPKQDLTVVEGYSNPEDEGTVGVFDIVETDKTFIRRSDAVIVGYKDVSMVGTPMEVMYTYTWSRNTDRKDSPTPIYGLSLDGSDPRQESVWWDYHLDGVHDSVDGILVRIE